jgi:hypothetical protein
LQSDGEDEGSGSDTESIEEDTEGDGGDKEEEQGEEEIDDEATEDDDDLLEAAARKAPAQALERLPPDAGGNIPDKSGEWAVVRHQHPPRACLLLGK